MINNIYSWTNNEISHIGFPSMLPIVIALLLIVVAIGAFCTLLSLPDEFSRKGVIPTLIVTTLIAPILSGFFIYATANQEPISDTEINALWTHTDPAVLTRNVNVWAAMYNIDLDATCALPDQEHIPICATGPEIITTEYFTAVHLDGAQGRYRIDLTYNPVPLLDTRAFIHKLDNQ